MNTSTSNCGSGCESGWTTYLDQLSADSNSDSLYKTNYYHYYSHQSNDYSSYQAEKEASEDLSMVSDASSGPPHLNYVSTYSVSEEKKNLSNARKEQTVIKKTHKKNLCLDDTASSSVFHQIHDRQDNATSQYHYETGRSQDFSDDHHHIEGESTAKKPLGFFKSAGKGKTGSLLGRKRQ